MSFNSFSYRLFLDFLLVGLCQAFHLLHPHFLPPVRERQVHAEGCALDCVFTLTLLELRELILNPPQLLSLRPPPVGLLLLLVRLRLLLLLRASGRVSEEAAGMAHAGMTTPLFDLPLQRSLTAS